MKTHRIYVLCNNKGDYCTIIMYPSDSSDYWTEMYQKFEAEFGGDSWCMEMDDHDQAAGMYYNYDLSRDGMLVNFIVFPGMTKEQEREAKHELKQTHDVVRVTFTRLKRRVNFDLPARVKKQEA